MGRYFTLEDAQRLLPEIEVRLRSALDGRQRLAEAERELGSLHRRVMLSGGAKLDPVHTIELRRRRDSSALAVKQCCDEIQEMGVQVKDLDIGLIDFPAIWRGEEVLLCWKLGEPEIAWWHGLEEGFRGRKPIDREFLRNLGDRGPH